MAYLYDTRRVVLSELAGEILLPLTLGRLTFSQFEQLGAIARWARKHQPNPVLSAA